MFIQSTPKSHLITTLPNKQQHETVRPVSARIPTGLSNDRPNTRNQTNDDSDYDQVTDKYQQHATHAESENIPLYVRKPQSTNSYGGASANSITPLKHEIIIPTTYSPLRNWKIQYLKKPVLPGSEVFNTVIDSVAPDDVKQLIFNSQSNNGNRNRTNSYETIASGSSHPPSVTPTSKTVSKFSYTFDGDKDYERPQNTYKSQNRLPTKFPSLEFRERLNRTFDATTPKPLVSPFASLQTILEDVKPTQYRPSLGSYSITIGKNNIQRQPSTPTTTTTTTTTIRPPHLRLPPQSELPPQLRQPQQPGQPPSSSSYFTSYYVIAPQPKNKTLNLYETQSSSSPSISSYPSQSQSPKTTPISITTNLPSVSSTQRPYEWTPIHQSSINNVQIHPNDERFRPIRPTQHPITFTENPIISITTSFPQKVNYENYYEQTSQHTGHLNPPIYPTNEHFPPYQTTTPISITTSTSEIPGFPPNSGKDAGVNGASTGGFAPIQSNTPRDHYRKVVRMRSKKKLTGAAGGLRPLILDPNVQQLSEDDPELQAMKNNNFIKALEAASFNEQSVEQSTVHQRGKPTKPSKPIKYSRPQLRPHHTTRVPNIHFNQEETLMKPTKDKKIQFMVDDDDSLVKYTILNDDEVQPTRYFSNYRQVKDENEEEHSSSSSNSDNHHSLGDYIKETKYAVSEDQDENENEQQEKEQEPKEQATLRDYVRDGAKFGAEVPEDMDEIIGQMTDTETSGSTDVISSSTELLPDQREKFRATVEMPEFNVPTESEIKARLKQLESEAEKDVESEYKYETTTNKAHRKISTDLDLTNETQERNQIDYEPPSSTDFRNLTYVPLTLFDDDVLTTSTLRTEDKMPNIMTSTQTRLTSSTTQKSYSSTNSIVPPRASRVNPAIKSTISGTPTRRMNSHTTPGLRYQQQTANPIMKCIDAKCNEIPSRYI